MGNKRLSLISIILFVSLISSVSSVSAAVDVTPNTAYTNNALTCEIDGDYVYEYRYEWRRNGVLYTGSLASENVFPASLTTRGQTISCGVFTAANFFLGLDSVVIRNSPPVINSATPSGSIVTMNEGSTRTFSVSASDADGDPLTRTWRRDGTTVGSGSSYSFMPSANRTYTIRHDVSDGIASVSRSWTVIVRDVNPSGVISSVNSAVEGSSVNFRATSLVDNPADEITTITWNFGDGTPVVTGENVNHIFTQQGTYTVTMTIRDEDSSFVTTKTITITDANPTAEILEDDPLTVDEGETVTFNIRGTGVSSDRISALTLEFGDNNSVSLDTDSVVAEFSLTHIYSDNGTYTARLTVSDEDNSAVDAITVNVLDVSPSFTLSVSSEDVDEGEEVEFEVTDLVDSPSDSVTSIEWDFGDGETDEGTSVVHTYSDQGGYEVTVRVYDEDSFTEESVIIEVYDVDPNAEFIFDPEDPFEGQLITFDASDSTDNPYDQIEDYYWDFGDGDTATGVSVTHRYTDSGTYTVTLVVTDEDSEDETSIDLVVANVDPSGEIAGPDPMIVMEGEVVNFTLNNLANGSEFDEIVSIDWDFGDGGTAAGESVSYIYEDDGDYVATVTITDEDSSITDSVDVEVLDAEPSFEVDANATVIDEGDYVSFELTDVVWSPYDPIDEDGVEWDFGDGGSEVASYDEEISYRFMENGTYTVTARVYDEDGFVERTIDIVVNDIDPGVEFTFDPSTLEEGNAIEYTYTLTGNDADLLTILLIDFGDGETSELDLSGIIPPGEGEYTITGVSLGGHTYSDNGTYTITFTLEDEDSSDSTSGIVIVTDTAPVANFSFLPVNPMALELVSFTDLTIPSEDLPLSYEWDFDEDGVVDSVLASPVYAYAFDGRYDVTLIVTDSDGSTSVATDSIAVGDLTEPPVVSIIAPADGSVFDRFVEIIFEGTADDNIDGLLSGSALTWSSDLDGILGTGNVLAVRNLSMGLHTITLSAIDLDGNVGSDSITVNITGDPGRLINTTFDGIYYANESTELIDSMNASIVRDSFLTSPLAILGSEINSSTLVDVEITDSEIRDSFLTNCTVINSVVKDIVASDCVFIDSFVDPSNLTGSTVTGDSRIINSNVTYSNVDASNITDSNIDISNITNSTIFNTTLSNVSVLNANISSGVIYNGNITSGNMTYDADSDGAANITDVLNLYPDAFFTVSPESGTTSTSFSFDASGSSDPNIPGPLSDSLSYSWSFGDGTSASGVSAAKTYSSTGTFTVVLTVTDSFGFSGTYTGSVSVSSSGSSGGGGGGGGGGSGGGTSLVNIGPLTNIPKIVNDVDSAETFKFTYGGATYKLKVLSITSSQIRVKLIETDESKTISRGDQASLELTNNLNLFVKYLEYRSAGSKISLWVEQEVPPSATQQNGQTASTSSQSSGVTVINTQPNGEGENETSAITGAAVTDIEKGKAWVGLLIALGILIVGLNLYFWIRFSSSR